MQTDELFLNSDDLKMQSILSDNMIIQRGNNTKIYGKAKSNQKVTIDFLSNKYITYCDENGIFEVTLSNLDAGGPYDMTITTEKIHKIKNILIGDVYLCSGQSNMQLPINRIFDRYKDEILNYENDNIRQFITSPDYTFKGPKEELGKGKWKSLKGKDTLDFSGVSYFFAKSLYEKYKVPIGIILTAVGGTPIEAWISEEKLKDFSRFNEEIVKCKNDEYVKEIMQSDDNRINAWYKELYLKDSGLNNYEKEEYDDTLWDSFYIPSKWKDTALKGVNGAVWFRKEINVSKSMAEKDAKLYLGTIIDSDTAYINGIEVGHTDYRYPPRKYDVPKGILRSGKNIISLRVISNTSIGEFISDKDYKIFNDDEEIKLDGMWKYKIGATMDELQNKTFFEYKPTGLYNGVIYPLRKYSIKGVLWYQGESNTHVTYDYEKLMETLINNFRETFKDKNLPFLYVQLPFYEDEENLKENWAEIRDAQMNCLKINNTGMVVSIDTGEYNDLHPLNKKDIGRRLAFLARNVVYGEDIVCKSPVCSKAIKLANNRIKLYFSNIGSGLIKKGEKLKGFEVCESVGNYVSADAEIIDNHVEVYSDKVQDIKEIRYCYLESKEKVTLYNREGFPAAPFKLNI